MDRPVLNPLVRELADSERFRAFLDELPDTRARVSESALPLPASTRGLDALGYQMSTTLNGISFVAIR